MENFTEQKTTLGLYDPQFEHDACGIGAVVDIKGRKSHQTVDDALSIVERLEHRAGKDAEGKTGDGVGILLQISHKFFSKVAEELNIRLGNEREYGVGMFFFPQNEHLRAQAMKLFEVVTRKEGLEFLETVKQSDFVVTDVSAKKGVEYAPRLFDLTSLQVECNKKFAYSADETLKLIQSLYEKKVTTYPRVDTTFLSDDIYPKVPNTLKGLVDYTELTAPLMNQKLPKSKKVFDNSKVTDHHAIIPTGVPARNLTDTERKVYDLVARRFIAAFYPDCEISTTTVLGQVDKVEFKVTGKQILKPGWRVVFGAEQKDPEAEPTEEEGVLPDFVKGESGPHKPILKETWTQPPKPYTEATLLRAMETAGKLVDNDELRDALKENGIGRPSTRAAIIETLFKRNYIRKERKNLYPTATGAELIGTIHEELLKSAELTGLWEKKLRQIERGTYEARTFLDELKQMVTRTA